jgi:hypothetical protein
LFRDIQRHDRAARGKSNEAPDYPCSTANPSSATVLAFAVSVAVVGRRIREARKCVSKQHLPWIEEISMRRCTRFLPSTAKWTALLLFTFAACNAASPKAFAQSPNKVIHLLCKGNYFTSGQGRIDIDLDNREIAGRREGTTHDGNGSTKVTKIAVTDAAYSLEL